MPEIATPDSGPLSVVLFLGDRSPYGLSIARACLSEDWSVRRVVVPSESAWERAAARVAERTPGKGLRDPVRRTLGKARRMIRPIPADVKIGEPIAPLVLDPGVTVEELEAVFSRNGTGWSRVDEVRSGPFRETVKRARPDLILSAAFPLILTGRLLSIAGRGAVNFHPSLLPRCRGCHPIYWTLASGESEGGVTAHFMTREVDAGDIVAQIPLPLSEKDAYAGLYGKAMARSEELVERVAEFFRSGRSRGVPQDSSRATYFHEDTEEDHRIRWTEQDPRQIVASARAGEAFTFMRGERVGLLEVSDSSAGLPVGRKTRSGQVVDVRDGTVEVAAATGMVALHRLAWRGRDCPADTLARTIGLKPGEVVR